MTEFETFVTVVLTGTFAAVCIFGALAVRGRRKTDERLRELRLTSRLLLDESIRTRRENDKASVL